MTAMLMAQRKEIHERLHPDAKLGRNQHSAVDSVSKPVFADETAAEIGKHPRTVRRNRVCHDDERQNPLSRIVFIGSTWFQSSA